jgi:hypothetical protein
VSASTRNGRGYNQGWELLHDRLPRTAVADTLNAEGHTTLTGLRWTWRHAQKTRDSLDLDDEAAAAL